MDSFLCRVLAQYHGTGASRRTNSIQGHVSVPGRKTSAYQQCKKHYLSNEGKDLRRRGFEEGEIQARANEFYRSLAPCQREHFEMVAQDENNKKKEVLKTRTSLVTAHVNAIKKSMSQLEELGCPSIWFGYANSRPVRQYSGKLKDLASDTTLTNYVLSGIVQQLAKDEMQTGAKEKCKSKGSSKRRKGQKRKRGNPEQTSSDHDDHHCAIDSSAAAPSQTKQGRVDSTTLQNQKSKGTIKSTTSSAINEGDEVALLDVSGNTVGIGIVTSQQQVHGRVLTAEWRAVSVKEVDRTVRPWKDFPTHSGKVEKASFIAWPLKHLAAKETPVRTLRSRKQ